MNTIATKISNEIVIQKSRFIAVLFPISSMDDITLCQQEVKNAYPNATHYCFAYIMDKQKRCSDDKEPSKTAGVPILNVLEKKHLNHILCMIVRYYGGIKLGAGGLVRAYTNATTSALQKATIIPIVDYDTFEISFAYEYITMINHILKDAIILNKHYQDVVTYQVQVDKLKEQEIKEKLKSFTIL